MITHFSIPWMHKGVNSIYEGALWAALEVIGGGDASLAQTLHDQNKIGPYSAYLHERELHIVALQDDVAAAIMRSPLARQENVQISISSFEHLRQQVPSTHLLSVSFLTPTAFRHDGQNDVLPSPKMLFGALLRRWQSHGKQELPRLDLEAVQTLELSINTIKVQYSTIDKPQRGMRGRVLYRLPNEETHWFHALARFGEYAGVGCRTTQGWGRIKIGRKKDG